MEERYISSPRPLFGDKSTIDGRIKNKRFEMGSKSNGVILDITKEGLYFNGYYAGLQQPTRYANLMEPGFISWEDLDKAKKLLEKAPEKKKRKRKARKKKEEPEIVEVEDEVTEEYLENLPVVTLAGRQYYIDPDRRERRMVANPSKVVKF